MRLLVKAKPGVTLDQLKNAVKNVGGKHKKRISQIGVDVFEIGATNLNKGSVVSALAGHRHIEFVEEDKAVDLAIVPNDTNYGVQWHLPKIGAPAAWDTTTGVTGGGTAVKVAVLDTGCDPTHLDLVGNYIAGWNFFDNNSDTTDVHGHGTLVAGTVAAVGNNARGVAGVAYSAKIMPCRISGLDGWASWSNIASAITWAADNGASVITNSYAAHESSSVQSAAQYAMSKGAVFVNSAGNTSAYSAVAASPFIITVSATKSDDTMASFSTFGPAVDISAPGSSIYTTQRGGTYAYASGTSFSAPIVAGVAALVKAAKPALSAYEIRDIVISTATDLGTAGRDDYFGSGRVNAAAAVAAAVAATPTSDGVAPVVAITAPAADATIQGTAIPVTSTASDNVGVTKVELLVNNVLYATDTTSPYNFTLNSTGYANGAATLKVKAYDAAGNIATDEISVTISNAVDTTPPVVTINSPADGAVVTGMVTVTASATDNMKVSKLSIYVDNVLKSSVNANTISYKLNTKQLTAGAHTIRATAIDTSNNTTNTSITVTK